MDEERDQIRQVEEARRRVADDVRSVAENAKVVERTKETVQGKVDDAKSVMGQRVRDARDRLENARDAMQDSMRKMTRNIGNMNLMENPIGMLFAGLAVGFLIGLVIPITRFETERVGPVAEDMRRRAIRRGTEVIKETIETRLEVAGPD
jgi:ElaB/YqjD/DUF883 family membrane-anchored ribosome-binding protein